MRLTVVELPTHPEYPMSLRMWVCKRHESVLDMCGTSASQLSKRVFPKLQQGRCYLRNIDDELLTSVNMQ